MTPTHVRLLVAAGLFWLLALLSVAGGLALMRDIPESGLSSLTDRYSYSFIGWEIRNLPNKLVYKAGHLLSSGYSPQERNRVLERYFNLTDEILYLQRFGSFEDRAELERKQRERASLENKVENILEGEITRLLEQEGLTVSPPLFDRFNFIFPPVDFELDNPPKILAISLRDTTKLIKSYQLQNEIDISTVERLEAEAEKTGVSALVLNIGGVATYPSVVPELGSLRATVNAAIHEWVHQYLALFPLGSSYFASSESRTINETVANIAGDELTRLLLRRYPLAQMPANESSVNTGLNLSREIRELRLEVEELLARGQVEQAEQLMEAKRQFFLSNGIYFRKINQAYFAFRGFYADDPDSIDPIGPKLKELRERSASLSEFMRAVSRITNSSELDQALLASR
ncbi:MAG TPA: hypothetical protein VNL15_03335 [Dehalococcoidia bacterium]|nr:hypothetical protein [Dehalococcoidia bacterium]